MDSLTKVFSQNAGATFLLLFILIIILAAMTLGLVRRTKRTEQRWRTLLEGSNGANLERLLESHLVGLVALEELTDDLKGRTRTLERKMAESKRRIGFVRYDAFEDVGGAQSFALALLDDQGDGAVVSSLIGRSDCRVYCKAIERGSSDKNLTPEEVKAVTLARSGN